MSNEPFAIPLVTRNHRVSAAIAQGLITEVQKETTKAVQKLWNCFEAGADGLTIYYAPNQEWYDGPKEKD